PRGRPRPPGALKSRTHRSAVAVSCRCELEVQCASSMSRDFALLLEHLRDKTGEVELDVPAAQAAGDGAMAARLARARDVAIRRGDRVAYLYKLVDGRRPGSNGAAHHPDLVTSVTDTECRALIAAGARWIGPAEHAPGSRPYMERLRVRDFRCIQE